MRATTTAFRVGAWVFGLSSAALGVVGLLWRDFTEPWLPAPAEGGLRTPLAILFSLLLLIGGAAILHPRFARRGGLLVAAVILLPLVLWMLRVAHYPQAVGTWLGVAEQSAVIAGAAILAALAIAPPRMTAPERVARGAGLVFGLCCLMFGVAHFMAMKETAALAPAWLPLGGKAWAMLTGAADILAGLAILTGVQAQLAAKLTALMFAIFGLLVWLPMLVAKPGLQMNWGGTAITFLLAGAALLVAEAAALQPAPLHSGRRSRLR